MANGKVTIMCRYCTHATWVPDYRCELHNANLPVRSAGTLNLICRDFAEGEQAEPAFLLGSQLAELEPHMQPGKRYGFPYPSHDRPGDLKELMAFTECKRIVQQEFRSVRGIPRRSKLTLETK